MLKRIGLIAFGLVICLLFIESGLRVAGSAYLSWQDYNNKLSLKKGDLSLFRILCLGESTTALGGEYSYPSQLEKILIGNLVNKNITVINKGMPGVDTTTIVSELPHLLNKYSPQIVIVMMGINDIDTYQERIKVISKLKGFIKTLRVYKMARLLYERMHSKDIFRSMYIERGGYYLERQRYLEAEEMFKKAIEVNPQIAIGYIWLARAYQEQNDYPRAEAMLKKAIQAGFKDTYDYIESGWVYYEMKMFLEGEEMFKRALELKPDDCGLHIEIAQFYQARKLFTEAENMFKKAIGLMKAEDSWPYSALGWHYFERGMFNQADEMFSRALNMHKDDFAAYRDLAFVKQAKGKRKEAEFYMQKSNSIVNGSQELTRINYKTLKDVVFGKGIKLICVQYPLRRLQDLKDMFDSREGVIFVDNDNIFKQALKYARYEDYFTDRFAGDFGHCTPKGNLLLAENISEVLIREFFSQQAGGGSNADK